MTLPFRFHFVPILSVIVLLGLAVAPASAQTRLFDVVDLTTTPLSASQAERLQTVQARPTTASLTGVRLVDTQGLTDGASLWIDLGADAAVLAVHARTHRNEVATTWSGTPSDAPGLIALSLGASDRLSGSIRVGSELYRVEPLGDGLHGVVHIDQRAFPEAHPTDDADRRSPTVRHDPTTDVKPRAEGLTAHQTPNATAIRIFVAYTLSAESAAGDMGTLIGTAFSETDWTYANSGVALDAEWVGWGWVNYSESGYTHYDHLGFLQNTSDGIMDYVHTWRNQYAADVVVLVVNDPSYCGLGYVGASAAYAFATVHYSCMTGNYTFAHELGHIHGARHDRRVDPANTPFQYGHGFVNKPDRWRTVMAYNDPNCAGGYCYPVPYWSNPYVTYGGDPMGTTTYEYNAQVLNVTAGTVAGFRSLTAPKVASSPDASTMRYALQPSAPNPTAGTTRLTFSVAESGPVQIGLYDLLGRKVKTLADRTFAPGTHQIEVSTAGLSSGTYLYRMDAGNGFTQTRRLVVVR